MERLNRRFLWLVAVVVGCFALASCGGGSAGTAAVPNTFTDDHPWYVEISATSPDGSSFDESDQEAAIASLNNRFASNGPTGAYAFAGDRSDLILVGLYAEPDAQTLEALGAPLSVDFRLVWGSAPADSALPAISIPEGEMPDEPAIEQAWDDLNCQPNDDRVTPAYDPGGEFLAACSADGQTKYILGSVAASSEALLSVVAQDQVTHEEVNLGRKELAFTFSEAGTYWFERVTTQLASDTEGDGRIAILIDGYVLTAPSIMDPITGGEAVINVPDAKQDSIPATVKSFELALAGYTLQVNSVHSFEPAS